MTRLLPSGSAERVSTNPEALTGTELLAVDRVDIGHPGLHRDRGSVFLRPSSNEHRQAINKRDPWRTTGTVSAVCGRRPWWPCSVRRNRLLTMRHELWQPPLGCTSSQDALNMDWADQGRDPAVRPPVLG